MKHIFLPHDNNWKNIYDDEKLDAGGFTDLAIIENYNDEDCWNCWNKYEKRFITKRYKELIKDK